MGRLFPLGDLAVFDIVFVPGVEHQQRSIVFQAEGFADVVEHQLEVDEGRRVHQLVHTGDQAAEGPRAFHVAVRESEEEVVVLHRDLFFRESGFEAHAERRGPQRHMAGAAFRFQEPAGRTRVIELDLARIPQDDRRAGRGDLLMEEFDHALVQIMERLFHLHVGALAFAEDADQDRDRDRRGRALADDVAEDDAAMAALLAPDIDPVPAHLLGRDVADGEPEVSEVLVALRREEDFLDRASEIQAFRQLHFGLFLFEAQGALDEEAVLERDRFPFRAEPEVDVLQRAAADQTHQGQEPGQDEGLVAEEIVGQGEEGEADQEEVAPVLDRSRYPRDDRADDREDEDQPGQLPDRLQPAVLQDGVDQRRNQEAAGQVAERRSFEEVRRAGEEVEEDDDDVAFLHGRFRLIRARPLDREAQALHVLVELRFRTMVDDHGAFFRQGQHMVVDEQGIVPDQEGVRRIERDMREDVFIIADHREDGADAIEAQVADGREHALEDFVIGVDEALLAVQVAAYEILAALPVPFDPMLDSVAVLVQEVGLPVVQFLRVDPSARIHRSAIDAAHRFHDLADLAILRGAGEKLIEDDGFRLLPGDVRQEEVQVLELQLGAFQIADRAVVQGEDLEARGKFRRLLQIVADLEIDRVGDVRLDRIVKAARRQQQQGHYPREP